MINATVSHELRNPLNSILAKNIEKENLYKQLSEQIRQLKNHVSHDTKTAYHFKKCTELVGSL